MIINFKKRATIKFDYTRIADAILKVLNSSPNVVDSLIGNIEIDDKWVKIPKSFFEVLLDETTPYEDVLEGQKHKGRPTITRLIKNIADSEVVGYFKKSLKTAMEKCKKLYSDITQFCVCFLKGIFNIFSPANEPYGKVTHYHRILSDSIEGIPTRKTLSNNYKWFVEWRVTDSREARDKVNKIKHRIWEKLIEWIQNYLLKIAPQYAIA